MTGRGWGAGHETQKEGPGMEEEKEEKQLFLKKKKKKQERGKIVMAMLSSLESHRTRGGLRTPKGKQYE